ncbi:KH domain-containing protein [Candidatus Gottesmanbacteria bacterium]|nr:KH domain-containing protein [Candidatus Gottesmanbacteria bacterium]MBI5452331.1 KH domain-containing protein [Candidatus Gottesmanbacteria bacterium]
MAKTGKVDKITKEIKETIADLLEKLKIEAEVEVTEELTESAGEASHYKVNIKTAETGLLIGHHGETLNSLQLISGVILYKKTGKWVRVILDVGDYRKVREDYIRDMVERIVAEVEEKGLPVTLPFFSPLERRIVHMMLSTNPKVTSESTGEGKDRRVTIKLRV